MGTLEVGEVVIGDIPSWRVDPMPCGGVKLGGLGREGIRFAIEEYERNPDARRARQRPHGLIQPNLRSLSELPKNTIFSRNPEGASGVD